MGSLTEVLALNALVNVRGDRSAIELLAELAGFHLSIGLDDSLVIGSRGAVLAKVCLAETGLEYTVRF